MVSVKTLMHEVDKLNTLESFNPAALAALMALHVPSLIFANVFIAATLAICLAWMARRERKDGMLFVVFALAAHCGAYALHLFHGQINAWLAIFLLAIACPLMHEGVTQLLAQKTRRLWIWLPVFAAGMLLPLLKMQVEAVSALLLALLLIQLAQMAWAMSKQWDAVQGRGKFVWIAGMSLCAIALPLKAQTAALGHIGTTPATDAYLTLPFFLAADLVAMVFCSFGIAMMALEKEAAGKHQLAFTDDLTGLYNRRYVQHALEQQIAQALRMQQPLSLLLIDVDFFKRINDTHGHLCGDQVLRDLAVCLKQLLRAGDIVGRWGGEEFMIILPLTDATGASALAERVRAAVHEYCFMPSENTIHPVTVSIGVHALHRIGAANPHSMLTVADQALYIAKNGGRNRVYVL